MKKRKKKRNGRARVLYGGDAKEPEGFSFYWSSASSILLSWKVFPLSALLTYYWADFRMFSWPFFKFLYVITEISSGSLVSCSRWCVPEEIPLQPSVSRIVIPDVSEDFNLNKRNTNGRWKIVDNSNWCNFLKRDSSFIFESLFWQSRVRFFFSLLWRIYIVQSIGKWGHFFHQKL